MRRTGTVQILGPAGLRGTASERAITGPPAQGGKIAVALEDGGTIRVARAALTPAGPGCYRLAGDGATTAERSADRLVVPVVREELDVRKRRVDRGGVRVRVTPGEREEVVDVPLEQRDVRVERIPIGREVQGPLQAREEDGVLVFPVVEEVLVVQKKWILREEVRISVERTRRSERRKVKLRTETATVERVAARDRGRDAGRENPAAGPGGGRGTRSRARR